MRSWSIYLLLAVLALGCNRAEEARRQEAAKRVEQIALALQNYRASQPQISSDELHVVQVGTEAVPRTDVPVEDISEIVDANNRFATDMYQQLRSQEGNLFFSPSSVSTALAMTLAGAAGTTEAEIAKTLHFQMPPARLHQAQQTLQAFWQNPDKSNGIQLRVANRLWGEQDYEFLPRFLQITREQYGAELARLDFANTGQATHTINTWIEDQTEGKITDLIPATAISADTRLVLTNAVYFNGDWSDPFNKKRTHDEDFHLTASETVKVPLMHRQASYRYAETEELQLLELPYGDGSLSMIVLLPRNVDGLAELEAGLTFENLDSWIAGIQHQEMVKVYLPKFKTTSQFQLSNTLKAMGMPSAFDVNSADFSGMTGAKDLLISAVIHKAFVDVNEEGTEAAAATGVAMATTAAPADPKEPPVFRADHPFIFAIRDNRNHVLLFLGRITDPTK